jgi:hypothetical protein
MSGQAGEWPDQDAPPRLDTQIPHSARVYDYWLGGKDNFAADREAAERAIAANPGIIRDVRANRAFLVRAVHYLAAERGIRQFLDIGTGLPTARNTHQVAQEVDPAARIVYVDNDPMVLLHARALLAGTREGSTNYVDADARDPEAILREAAKTLDFSKPSAVLLLIILHLIPDEDRPYDIVAALMEAMAPGSYLVLSHAASDIRPAEQAEMTAQLNERISGPRATMRDRAAVTRFFDGLELLEPGVVQPQQWRPGPGVEPNGSLQVTAWCGVARKPLVRSSPYFNFGLTGTARVGGSSPDAGLAGSSATRFACEMLRQRAGGEPGQMGVKKTRPAGRPRAG